MLQFGYLFGMGVDLRFLRLLCIYLWNGLGILLFCLICFRILQLILILLCVRRKLLRPFQKDIQIVTYRKQLEKTLKQINKKKSEYMIVCTGHQGEPGSILDRISRNKLPYELSDNDHIIFSSKTIPTPASEVNREQLGRRLKKKKVRIFDNVHVSGHGGREDLRDLINLTNPQHMIPSHGDLKMLTAGADLAQEMGYKMDKTVHLTKNGSMIELK